MRTGGDSVRGLKAEQRNALVFFAAMALKYLLFGFRYYPILDDYIQYGGYPLYHDLSYVYFHIGTMATRPLASLLDPLLWGSLWNCMGVSLMVITLLHFFAAYATERTLSLCGYQMSPLFWIIILFLPLGSEGAYWISASSRLAVGLFFAAGSLYCLAIYLKEGKKLPLALFLLFHLLSYGFYEAVSIFSFLGAYLVMLKKRETPSKAKWLPAVPMTCLVLMLTYYVLCANIGAMGSRVGGVTFLGLFGKLWDAVYQLGWIFTKGLAELIIKGSLGGLRVLRAQGLWGAVWILAAAVACVFVYRISKQHGKSEKNSFRQQPWILFLCGALLFIAPLAPNVLAETVWLPYRNIFVSLFGLALMAEPVFSAVFRGRRAKGAVCALVLFLCLVSWVNEYDTYRRVSETDIRLAENIAEQLDEEVLAGRKDAVVVLEKTPETHQANFYKDHVKSVFAADWSLTGAVRAVTKNMKIHLITPVIGEAAETEQVQVLYMDADGHVTRCE